MINLHTQDKRRYPIAALCRLFGVTKQAYFKDVEQSGLTRLSQEAFAVEFIHSIRKAAPGIGGMKLWYMYSKEFSGNAPLGRDRFETVVDKYGLKVRPKIRKPRTTDSRHGLPLYPNLIKTFIPTGPNQLRVSDITYIPKNVQVKLGRQRVNWGMGLVWNPNDIFNAFSYIDFDYEERPGSDAVSVTWYRSSVSSLDVVGKVDKNPVDSSYQYTAAARYLFNAKNYDFQVIAGKSNNDIVGGFGWSGAIKNVSFRGEMSVFIPVLQRNINNKTAVVATVEADYTFENQLYLHGAALFNSSGKIETTESMNLFATQNDLSAKKLSYGMFEIFTRATYPVSPIFHAGLVAMLNPAIETTESMNLFATQNDLSAKKLSYGMFEIFTQATYPVSPIFHAGLAAMLNPADASAYLSPNCTFSLADNLELMLNAQFLLGKPGTEYAANGNIYAAFARLKWSF